MQKILVIMLVMPSATMAQAQQSPTISQGGSTLRATLDVEYRIGPSFGARGMAEYGHAVAITSFNWLPTGSNFSISGESISTVPNVKHGQISFLPFVKLSVSSAF